MDIGESVVEGQVVWEVPQLRLAHLCWAAMSESEVFESDREYMKDTYVEDEGRLVLESSSLDVLINVC